MNMFKKNGGFTLVELIVVIAILAILAGVAVPVYSGYISKANEAADYTMLDSVKTAAVFAAMEEDYNYVVDTITVTAGDTGADTVAVTTAVTGYAGTCDGSVDISDYLGSAKVTFKSGATSAIYYTTAPTGTTSYKAGWNLVFPES